MTCSSSGPAPPEREDEPTSSWSKQARTVTSPEDSASSSATRPACTEDRLSRREEAKNSSVGPNTAGASVT